MEAVDTSTREARMRAAIGRLVCTQRLHHKVVDRRLEGMGVHHSQHRMLMKVSKLGRSASQKDIADAMDVSPACVARTLKCLSGEGLIEKREGADGRCNEISILPEGRRLVDDSLALFTRINAEMFEGVSDAELDALSTVLRRIQGNLTAMEQGENNPERTV